MANLRVDKITSTETFETTGSVQFDGSGDYLDVTESNNDFDFDGDFTIEFWVYFNTVNARNDTVGSANNSVYLGASKSGWIASYYTLAGNKWHFSYQSNQAWIFEHTFSFTSDASRWYHVAFTREDSSIKCFVDGVQQGATKTSSTTLTSTENSVRVGGGEGSTSLLLNGYVSNLRVIKGKALYTSNFKPPMRELEVTPETVLLACQSKTDASLEKTGKTITVNGNAVASELTPGILTPVPKAGGGSAITGSVEFDGNESYLTIPSSSDFTFDSDFTVEAWVFPSSKIAGGNNAIYSNNMSGEWNDNGDGFHIDTNRVELTGNGSVNYPSNLDSDAWTHIALVRSGSNVVVYKNGVTILNLTNSNTFGNGSNKPGIGLLDSNAGTPRHFFAGNISNLRVVKGTALYVDDFIPPTRELKKVPGTVLLCCQDSNNPLTEATGKTITPYGSLGDGSLGQELVTNDSVWTLTKGGSGATDWTVSNNGRSLAGTTVTSGFMRATYTLDEGDYLVSLRWTGGNFAVQDSTGFIVATDGTDTDFGSSEDGAYSFYMSDTTSVVITASSWNTAYTVDDISIKRIYKNNGASNFTPQVGDDRKVTFEGVTKINSDAYFYLPTGDTVTRESRYGRSRGLIVGGGNSDTIEFINIASTGNAQDYGNLSATTSYVSALSSSTRGVYSRSRTPSSPNGDNTLEYSTLASTGNSIDFGDRTEAVYDVGALSSSIRGIIGGGYGPANSDVIDYVTISSTGNALDFGDLTQNRRSVAGLASPTRGCFAAGYQQPDTTTETNIIDYVTIASTGNALDFGDLTAARWGPAPMASSTRGVFGGGIDPNALNLIDYITIASTGNANDFGDLSQQGTGRNTGISNSVRGVAGIYITPAYQNSWEYITIQSMGNAQDFGESAVDNTGLRGGCSDSHGGLG